MAPTPSDRAIMDRAIAEIEAKDAEIERLRAENERLQDALDRCIEARLARLGLAGDDQECVLCRRQFPEHALHIIGGGLFCDCCQHAGCEHDQGIGYPQEDGQ